MDVQGQPDWVPNLSLGTVEAWKSVEGATTKQQREDAIGVWLKEVMTDLELSIFTYKRSLMSKTSAMKQLRRGTREEAAKAMQDLGSLDQIEAWWRNFYNEVAQEWRQKT